MRHGVGRGHGRGRYRSGGLGEMGQGFSNCSICEMPAPKRMWKLKYRKPFLGAKLSSTCSSSKIRRNISWNEAGERRTLCMAGEEGGREGEGRG